MTDEEIEVIVKPIFTKMFNSNFSACEYGIECYKKGMEYQGIKELAIENDNLIKQVEKLKQQIEKIKCCENCLHKGFGRNLEFRCNIQGHIIKNPFEEKCDKWEIKEND